MTDEQLQQLMAEAASSYRVPKDAPVDAMWAQIEAEHFDGAALQRKRATPWHRWGRAITGIAATLLVGFGIGRFSAPEVASLPGVVVAQNSAPATDPLQRTTSRYLDDAALLLASLPADGVPTDSQFTARAALMLTMTRVLLDSPTAQRPELYNLLEDLELVLAQVVRLSATGRTEELTFITAAMNERDVVERLRTVAAAMSYSDF